MGVCVSILRGSRGFLRPDDGPTSKMLRSNTAICSLCKLRLPQYDIKYYDSPFIGLSDGNRPQGGGVRAFRGWMGGWMDAHIRVRM